MATVTVEPGGTYDTWDAAVAAAGTGGTINIEGDWSSENSGNGDTTQVDYDLDNVTTQINAAASEHPGYYQQAGSHYKLNVSAPAQGRCIQIDSTGGVIDGVAIRLRGNDVSDEACRFLANSSCTFKNTIAWASQNVSNQDGFYIMPTGGSGTVTATFINCLAIGFYRAGFHIQNYSNDGGTYIISCIGCGAYDCQRDTNSGGFVCANYSSSSPTYTLKAFYCWADDGPGGGGGGGSQNWFSDNGTGRKWQCENCCSADTSLNDTVSVVDDGGNTVSCALVDTYVSGTKIVVESLTVDSEDLRLTGHASCVAHNNDTTATATSGLAIADASPDFLGNTRPQDTSYDVGPHEYVAPAAGGVDIEVIGHYYRHLLAGGRTVH